jgi:hypothetical protein
MISENQRQHMFGQFKSPRILSTAIFILVSIVALGGLLYHLNLRLRALDSLFRENSRMEDRISATFATLSAMEKIDRPPFSREKFSIIRGYIVQMQSVVFSALHDRAPALTHLEKGEWKPCSPSCPTKRITCPAIFPKKQCPKTLFLP